MSRFNTGNPIGSADPRDRDDNSKNLDEAVNTQADRWTDRFGNERVSLASAVDPTGFAQSALNDANRAETARDAAFVNADVYDDTAAGISGTSDGEQFQVVDGFEVVRYRNESGDAVEVARYSSAEKLDEVEGTIRQNDPGEVYFAIADEAGFARFIAESSGGFGTKEAFAGSDHLENEAFLIQPSVPGVGFSVADEYGYYSVFTTDGDSLGGQEALEANVADLEQEVAEMSVSSASSSAIPTAQRRIIAHRGTKLGGIAPENSLDAYRLAARAGYTLVETDVLKTADGEFVLMHDTSINRTMRNASDYSTIDTTVNVIEETLPDLRANYVLKADEPRFRRPIPTYAEFLATCRDHALYPVIELKNTSFTNADLEALTNQAIRVLGEEGFAFTSFNGSLLDYVRTLNDKVELYYILGGSSADIDRVVANAPAALYANYSNYTDAVIAECREKSVKTAAWTIPNHQYDDLLALGLDEFATDTIAPELTRQSVIFHDYSDGTFEAYQAEGVLVDGALVLSDGQTATLSPDALPDVYLGAYYLMIDYRGEIELSATRLSDSASYTGEDHATYSAQCLLHNQGPSLTITAGPGGCVIKDISIAIARF